MGCGGGQQVRGLTTSGSEALAVGCPTCEPVRAEGNAAAGGTEPGLQDAEKGRCGTHLGKATSKA